MAERSEYTITEAGYDAMAAARMRASFARGRRSGQWQDVEITPAGLAALRDYELAHATAQGAGQVPGASLPKQPAAARPERPAAAAEF